MANPLAGLRPALEVIAQEAQILPATGQAIEDLMRPDQDETYDLILTGPDDKLLDVLIEAPNRATYVETPALYRTQKHLFRYFLDGSARTYFIGTAIEGDRQTPIHVAQIGAAAILREDDGQVHVAKSAHKLVLLMDRDAVSFGAEVEQTVKRAGAGFEFVDLKEDDTYTQGTGVKEPRSRAAHKANWRMRMLEWDIAREVSRPEDHWLVLDGGLGSEFREWRDGRQFLGVAKSFRRDPQFSVKDGRGKKPINLYQLLADLPEGHRTAAFSILSGTVAVWYVRIRPQKHLDYPLMGVVKVEYPNPSGDAMPSGLIDELSRALVAERCETPHGKDVRWHAHLYAIFLAEQAVKNGFLSPEALKAGLRWPTKTKVSRP
jgi:hypothetical protein